MRATELQSTAPREALNPLRTQHEALVKLGAGPNPSRKLPSREGGGWYSDAPNRPRPTDRYCAAAAATVAPLSQRSLGPSGTGCRGGPCRAASHLMVNTFGLLSLIPSQGAPLRPRLKARARPRWLQWRAGPAWTSGAADRANGNEAALHLPAHAACRPNMRSTVNGIYRVMNSRGV